MFIEALIPKSEQIKTNKNTATNQLNNQGANPNVARETLKFLSLNLGGPQYQEQSKDLIEHLSKIIKLENKQELFFFQEATKQHLRDIIQNFFKDNLKDIHIYKDKEKNEAKNINGYAVLEGDQNWYVIAPDYKKISPTETELINNLAGIANFISGKDMKQYSENHGNGYSYLLTVIPKSFAKNINDLKIERNNSNKFLETTTTHVLHHIGMKAMGWGERKNYVLKVSTPEIDTANIHLSAVGTPYRRFLEIFSTALMLKGIKAETRTDIFIELDKLAKANFLKKDIKSSKAQIIAGDANFFRSAMGHEPSLFTKIIKPLLKSLFGIHTQYPTGKASFKPTANKASYGIEELDIALANNDSLKTQVIEIPKDLTDHDLLESKIQL